MFELAAWRNTSVSRMTGTAPRVDQIFEELARSHRRQLVYVADHDQRGWCGHGLEQLVAKGTSIIEHSSATRRSHSRGLSALRLNWPLRGSTSSSDGWSWLPARSVPLVAWPRGPVGAQSRGLTPLAVRTVRIDLTRVLFPTPGPPVMTSSFEERASRIAFFWLSASSMGKFLRPMGSPWRNRMPAGSSPRS